MVEVCALASGSNGNCYYIGNKESAVLIDAGLSRRQILERMKKVGLNISKVKAIFISHEHTDHARGVRVLSNKQGIPVFMTQITFNNSRQENRPEKYRSMIHDEWIKIGDIEVKPFSKLHDAVDPCSFLVRVHDLHIGVLTDIGNPCENVISNFKICDVAFLETNYDEKMLLEGPYPAYLKYRVSSSKGHLSNNQAISLIDDHAGDNLTHIFLSHISQENNHPDVIMNSFEKYNGRYNILLTNRYAPTKVFEL